MPTSSASVSAQRQLRAHPHQPRRPSHRKFHGRLPGQRLQAHLRGRGERAWLQSRVAPSWGGSGSPVRVGRPVLRLRRPLDRACGDRLPRPEPAIRTDAGSRPRPGRREDVRRELPDRGHSRRRRGRGAARPRRLPARRPPSGTSPGITPTSKFWSADRPVRGTATSTIGPATPTTRTSSTPRWSAPRKCLSPNMS